MKQLRIPAVGCACVLAIIGCSAGTDFEKPRDKDPITYPSDSLRINALISKPQGRGPFPLLLVNHGGFEPASSVASIMDLFTEQGFVTLAPDLRGCGKTEGLRELAKGEVEDVLNALKYTRDLSYVDARRVGIWGFSSGATTSLLAASRSGEIRAVVAVQGPTELADCYRGWVKNKDKPEAATRISLASVVGGTPDHVPHEWKVRSPLYVADRIKCPVLLIYGDRDDAVPVDQGSRMELALKASGNRSVSLLMLEGANHGLDETAWAKVMGPMMGFLKRELGAGGP